MRCFACVLLVFGCAKAPPAPQSKAAPVVAVAAPSASGSAAAAALGCDDAAPLHWLGSASNGAPGHVRVNTPLALGGSSVVSAGVGCCAGWAGGQRIWTALDRFGQVAGTARVAKSSFYDVTQCAELQLSVISGTRGVDVWVSAPSFQAASSAEWQPSAGQRDGLVALVKTIEGAMLPGPAWADCDTKLAPLAARTLFYRSRESDERVHERAVVGGPLLIVAERDARRGGAWIASFVDTSDATSCLPAQFTPKAVIDLNQDGVPEVVVHTDDGPIFGDLVYGFQQVGGWQVVARGVPGSSA